MAFRFYKFDGRIIPCLVITCQAILDKISWDSELGDQAWVPKGQFVLIADTGEHDRGVEPLRFLWFALWAIQTS